MAQLTVYIDEETMGKIQMAAKKERTSVSKWVKKRLVGDLKRSWPPGYFNVLGSLRDVDSFERPPQGSFADDVRRTNL